MAKSMTQKQPCHFKQKKNCNWMNQNKKKTFCTLKSNITTKISFENGPEIVRIRWFILIDYMREPTTANRIVRVHIRALSCCCCLLLFGLNVLARFVDHCESDHVQFIFYVYCSELNFMLYFNITLTHCVKLSHYNRTDFTANHHR